MQYRVYLGGQLLSNLPMGLDKFNKEFVRDNELFGIYVSRSFDLVFVGDGYCILKDFQIEYDVCSKDIIIQQYCNGAWNTIFNGLIEVSSIEIDESNGQATCEIQDNSPLILLSRNAEISIDIEATKDIFGGDITPPGSYSASMNSPTSSGAYTSKLYDYGGVFRQIISSITGVECTVTSTYLDTTPQPCVHVITFSGDLNNIIDTTVVFKNFQGETQTITANFQTGSAHLVEVAKRLESSTQFVANTNANISKTMQYNDDFRNFYSCVVNTVAKTITCYSNLPIEIISTSSTGFTPITTTFSKTQDFVDGGGIPYFTNYVLLKNQQSPYQFTLSFKEVMEVLNKEYNVYFLATYNSSGGIDFRIENFDYFYPSSPNYTFDNVKNLKVKFNDTIASKQIAVGDSSDTTLATRSLTFNTSLCGIGQSFDANTQFITGTVKIYEDLASTFDVKENNSKYLFSNSVNTDIVYWSDGNYITSTIYSGYVYNIYLTNWHKIYRHFSKFKSNIIGQASYFDTDTIDYSINIENTSTNRLLMDYTFNESMSNSEFDSLVDNIVDLARFKKNTDSVYREGIITNINYNYITGEAEITILGK